MPPGPRAPSHVTVPHVRRPLRSISAALTALSTAFLAIAATAWIRSERHVDHWIFGTSPDAYALRSQAGFLDLEYTHIAGGWHAAYGTYHDRLDPDLRAQYVADRPLAAAYQSEHVNLPPAGLRPAVTGRAHLLRLRYWLICLVTALAPTIHLFTWMRHRHDRQRTPTTLCPTCKYDCRATPTRCPECGTTLTPV